ncbi:MULTISPECIES: CHASE2 domain-containing protein [unclassified Coleofasciculus]|uniref:CHASE2 domain-containing protein n=1 Tax=unclassified Coleofasciculus TaxID=2692782 RepID=UPI0018808B9E|nr:MULTISPECIES: CHASE2 domain-containing protein [unclassified Coleofasciculus]MBE9124890.1 CHASE2 domain-containing protein [Coleofasciculus sp. LEGE 07081]MBE9147866.1 CHASE2 domain-containing protein [Coleofasciculus sp. LEGE 07092]
MDGLSWRQPVLAQDVTLSDSVVTMVFTDLVSSTAVKKYLNGSDITARNRLYFDNILKPHRQRVETSLAIYGGRVVKTEGDAYFLVFASAAQAAQWAVALQISHMTDPIDTPLGPLQVKIGMHTGSPLPDGDDFIGEEVDYAARVSSQARGGQILLSEVTTVLVRNVGLVGSRLVRRGTRNLKGIGKVPLFELLYLSKKQQQLQKTRKPQRLGVQLLASLAGASVAIGVGLSGMLQPLEMKTFDHLMQARPQNEAPDPRLLLITITESDVQAQSPEKRKGSSLSNSKLDQLLKTLVQYQPRVIGIDLYRDFPIEPQHQDLANRLGQDNRLISVCKIGESEEKPGIPPPPDISSDSVGERVGFSDVATDSDGIVRRQLLGLAPPEQSVCQTSNSLSLAIALRYLEPEGITAQLTETDDLQIGSAVFRTLQKNSGGYNPIDAGGYQTLLNYRATGSMDAIAPQYTLKEVLEEKKLTPELVRDRIILIGTVDETFQDFHVTPYHLAGQSKTAGVVLQAHMISQIISAAQDERPLLWWWSQWAEYLWIGSWSLVGCIVTWRCRSILVMSIAVGGTLCILYGGCYFIFTQGGWVPFVPSALAIVVTSGLVRVYYSHPVLAYSIA